MIIPGQRLREIGDGGYGRIVWPFCPRTRRAGVTFGVGPAGYDVRIAEDLIMWPGRFALVSTVERFDMPDDVLAIVHDKSTWVRRGLSVFNTVIEPGWRGFLTLELKMNAPRFLRVRAGSGIAQIVFHRLEAPTERPYRGKYMDQPAGPQAAIMEK